MYKEGIEGYTRRDPFRRGSDMLLVDEELADVEKIDLESLAGGV